MNETSDTTLIPHQSTLAIEIIFAKQRETAIALRSSTAAMRIAELRKLEASVLAHHDAITRALAADLRRPAAETDLLEILPMIAGLRHARRHLTS